MVRDGISEKATLEWKTKLREQTIQIHMMRIFQEEEIASAKAGEYSMCSGSNKKASRTGAGKSAGKWPVTQLRNSGSSYIYLRPKSTCASLRESLDHLYVVLTPANSLAVASQTGSVQLSQLSAKLPEARRQLASRATRFVPQQYT